MIVGYARVSTLDQNLDLQLDELKAVGCTKIYSEKVSGAKSDRIELTKLLEHVREGDTVVVWKLDRLGRSLSQLVDTVTTLNEKGIAFRSLKESIDTTSSTGKLIFHIFASLAEFERDIIRDRTNAGLQAARVRGKKGGRPTGLSKENQMKANAAVTLYKDGNGPTVICKQLSISKETLYRWLRLKGVEIK